MATLRRTSASERVISKAGPTFYRGSDRLLRPRTGRATSTTCDHCSLESAPQIKQHKRRSQPMDEQATSENLLDATISHATVIHAKPERIFRLLATGEGWDSWFTSGATVDPRPGGEITWRWRNWGPDSVNADDVGIIVEAQSPRR